MYRLQQESVSNGRSLAELFARPSIAVRKLMHTQRTDHDLDHIDHVDHIDRLDAISVVMVCCAGCVSYRSNPGNVR